MDVIQLQSMTAAYQLFVLIIVLVGLVVFLGLRIYYRRYAGTGEKLDPKLLWRRYSAVLAVLLVVGFGYLNLDYYCSFDVSLDKTSYNAGEVVELNCTITNPLPIPVYYRGHGYISTEASYLNGAKVPRTQLTISEAAAQAAAEQARAASGEFVNKGFIMPYGEKTVKTVRYTPTYEGEITVDVEYNGFKSESRELNQTIEEYSPIGATVDSTGITLYLENSDDTENPTILIRVRNDNPYPVRFPVFSVLTTNYGTPNSEMKTVVFIEWVVLSFEIPAYSSLTIYDTDSFASPNRTPIYFTLYGKTLKYPLEP